MSGASARSRARGSSPRSLTLDPAAGALLVDAAGALARLGFEIEPFGEATVAVRGIPALLSGSDPAQLLRELAAELVADPEARRLAGDRPPVAAVDRLFASRACHEHRRFIRLGGLGNYKQHELGEALKAALGVI